MTEAKDWAGELISGQTTTGRILVSTGRWVGGSGLIVGRVGSGVVDKFEHPAQCLLAHGLLVGLFMRK